MKIKRVALITRDCAGANAAIRSIVRSACNRGVEIFGVMRGYEGLIDNDLIPLNHNSVSGIINRGGTLLKTSRSKRFRNASGRRQAAKTVKDNSIDGLIVVGGNGSLTGAHLFTKEQKIPVVGVPATIDNDINGVQMTLGADSATNVAMRALDKIRDTAISLERIFVIEVMGRNCGYIALRVALAGGCEEALLPERSYNIEKICESIVEGNIRGKISWIIVVAEGRAKAPAVAKKITEITGLETREVVLGHVQRGGSPTAFDRILAARYGNYALEQLLKGKTDCCVAIKDDKLTTIPLSYAIKHKDIEINDYYKLVKILT